MGAVIAAERKDMRDLVAERVTELRREFEPKLAAAEKRLGTISEKLRIAEWVDSEQKTKVIQFHIFGM
jgi:transcription elongation GreA/GreB family factor